MGSDITKEAFERNPEIARPLLTSHAKKFLSSWEDVEDATQDALYSSFMHLARYDPKKASLTTWLRAIVRRKALSRLRYNKLRAERYLNFADINIQTPTDADRLLMRQASRLSFSADPSKQCEDKEFMGWVETHLLNRLPTKQRNAFGEHMNGKTFNELACEANEKSRTIQSRERVSSYKLAKIIRIEYPHYWQHCCDIYPKPVSEWREQFLSGCKSAIRPKRTRDLFVAILDDHRPISVALRYHRMHPPLGIRSELVDQTFETGLGTFRRQLAKGLCFFYDPAIKSPPPNALVVWRYKNGCMIAEKPCEPDG